MVERPDGWNVRRRFKRYSTHDVSGRIEASTSARVVDISLKGMAVETPIQLKIGRTYQFQLGQGEDQVNVAGRVRWSQLRGTRRTAKGDVESVYQSGIAIGEMLTAKAMQFIDFIERFANVAPGERMFARLKPELGAAASIGSEVGVRVRQISREGLLVESELGLEPDSVCDVALKLGDEVFRSRARVVHVDVVASAPPAGRHRIGLELVEPAREERKRLLRFIKRELVARGVGTRVSPPQAVAASPAPVAGPAAEEARPQPAASGAAPAFRGHPKRKIFHRRGCRNYGSAGCTAEFSTRDAAIADGFRPCKLCRP
jgi:hypothetical protein